MTDKELLELAAKAAGIELYQWVGKECCYEEEEIEGFELWFPFKDHRSRWNPLINDDDALRLAVTLGLLVDMTSSVAYATNGDAHAEELCEDDAFAATRRAIVRAAAEIAKAKGE